MDSRHLTVPQLQELHRVIHQSLGYLNRLRERMERRGFPHDDKLYLLVVDAADKMHHLAVELHYSSCTGVGRPPRKSG